MNPNEMREHHNSKLLCENLLLAARTSLILNGEMSEWLKEHAWKAKLARNAEEYAEPSTRTPSTNSPLGDIPQCDPVTVHILGGFQAHVSQSYHNRLFI